MKTSYFCPIWGAESLPFPEFLNSVANAGFDGIEMSFPVETITEESKLEYIEMIRKSGLRLIAQHWETVTCDFKLHKAEFEQRLWSLVALEPVLINSQTGRDFFTFEQISELLDIADKVETSSGVKILHETHRGRFSFAPNITEQFIDKRENLKLTADFSHWCCVSGSLLEEQQRALNKAIERTHHIHSRVGHAEGSQIPDPQAPQWQKEVNAHINWWKQIVSQAKSNNFNELTITTEFGPPPYMPILPYTGDHTCNQWQANIFMMNLLKSEL